jgi:hypothetical protein
MKSRLDDHRKKFKDDPTNEKQIANLSFVYQVIDKAINEHRHDGTDGKLIDQSVTLDFNMGEIVTENGVQVVKHGDVRVRTPTSADSVKTAVNVEFTQAQMRDHATKRPIDHPDYSVTVEKLVNNLDLRSKDVYVKTPAASSGQGELPDTSSLGDTYTKTTIDNKLAGKSDTGHTHVISNITDFPTALKNPQPLTINGQTYDGSSEMSFNITTTDYIDSLVSEMGADLISVLNQKSDINHFHSSAEILIPIDNESKNLQEVLDSINNKMQELENKITSENTKLETLITNEVSRLESLITSEISRLELILLNNQEEEL